MKNTYEDPVREEREILVLLYEVQEKMEPLIKKGNKDPDYIAVQRLVTRLERYITDNSQTII